MTVLGDLAEKIGLRFKQLSRRHFRASLLIKILVTVAATIAGGAEILELAAAAGKISYLTVAALVATVLIALGGLYSLFMEQDVSLILNDAREALEKARTFEQEKTDFEMNIAWLNNEVTRGLELYNSMDVMRGAIEQSLGLPNVSPAQIIDTCLQAARNSLLIAFGFEIGDTWTICIYAAERDKESDKVALRCIAHDRTIKCNLSQARVWYEGTGIIGLAYSNANEIIIPDMTATELGTAFDLKDQARSHDRQRYRSMIAVPVMVGTNKIPWGVAVATSNQPNHFSHTSEDGVSTSEPARAVAAMAALAVKALAKPSRATVALAKAQKRPVKPRKRRAGG